MIVAFVIDSASACLNLSVAFIPFMQSWKIEQLSLLCIVRWIDIWLRHFVFLLEQSLILIDALAITNFILSFVHNLLTCGCLHVLPFRLHEFFQVSLTTHLVLLSEVIRVLYLVQFVLNHPVLLPRLFLYLLQFLLFLLLFPFQCFCFFIFIWRCILIRIVRISFFLTHFLIKFDYWFLLVFMVELSHFSSCRRASLTTNRFIKNFIMNRDMPLWAWWPHSVIFGSWYIIWIQYSNIFMIEYLR